MINGKKNMTICAKTLDCCGGYDSISSNRVRVTIQEDLGASWALNKSSTNLPPPLISRSRRRLQAYSAQKSSYSFHDHTAFVWPAFAVLARPTPHNIKLIAPAGVAHPIFGDARMCNNDFDSVLPNFSSILASVVKLGARHRIPSDDVRQTVADVLIQIRCGDLDCPRRRARRALNKIRRSRPRLATLLQIEQAESPDLDLGPDTGNQIAKIAARPGAQENDQEDEEDEDLFDDCEDWKDQDDQETLESLIAKLPTTSKWRALLRAVAQAKNVKEIHKIMGFCEKQINNWLSGRTRIVEKILAEIARAEAHPELFADEDVVWVRPETKRVKKIKPTAIEITSAQPDLFEALFGGAQ